MPYLIADTVEDVVDGVDPGGPLPDGADRDAVDADGEGLGAVRVEGGAAAALYKKCLIFAKPILKTLQY